eukprot:scaffold45490_cov54-Phaeocystis_antarctica.AAC.3
MGHGALATAPAVPVARLARRARRRPDRPATRAHRRSHRSACQGAKRWPARWSGPARPTAAGRWGEAIRRRIRRTRSRNAGRSSSAS